MGGVTRIVIFEKSIKPISFIAMKGSENDCFFSETFLKGNIKKAIKNLITNAKNEFDAVDTHLTIAPEDYGLTLIDFNQQKLFSLTSYDTPGKFSLMGYETRITSQFYDKNYFQKRTQEGLFKVVNTFKKETYSIEQFFGTQEFDKIAHLINAPKLRKKSNGIIQEDLTSGLHDYGVFPHNFNLDCHYYRNPSELFIDLYNHNYTINQNDLSLWYEYLEDSEDEKVKVQTFYQIQEEKKHLEKTLVDKKDNVALGKLKI